MSPMLSLLQEMRGRLGMYLGTSSLGRLAAFLRGYDLAVERLTGQRDPFLPAFRDWVHQRFHSSHQSWEETIQSHSGSETEAVKHFWALLDEYLRDHPTAKMTESTDANGAGCSAPRRQVADP